MKRFATELRSLGSVVCNVFLFFVTFPYGFSGEVWYLFVSIPDLCLLYFFLTTLQVSTGNLKVLIQIFSVSETS